MRPRRLTERPGPRARSSISTRLHYTQNSIWKPSVPAARPAEGMSPIVKGSRSCSRCLRMLYRGRLLLGSAMVQAPRCPNPVKLPGRRSTGGCGRGRQRYESRPNSSVAASWGELTASPVPSGSGLCPSRYTAAREPHTAATGSCKPSRMTGASTPADLYVEAPHANGARQCHLCTD